MSSESSISRRDLVCHLGAGVVGAVLTAAVPAAQAQSAPSRPPRHSSTRRPSIRNHPIWAAAASAGACE
jgi:hypothetical protein